MMGGLLNSRRRVLRAKGRPMTLRRLPAVDVTVTTILMHYSPERPNNGLAQGDAWASIMADEINAAGWPGPPRKGDRVIADGQTYAITGVAPVFDGTESLGFNLWLKGGNP